MSTTIEEKLKKFKELKEKRKVSVGKVVEKVTEKVTVRKKGVEEKKRKFKEIESRKQLLDDGVDLERHDNLQYSLQDVIQWNEKLDKKQETMNTDFKSYASTAYRKYQKDIKELDLVKSVDSEPEASTTAYGSRKDTPEAINNLVNTLKRQDEKKKAFSRRRELKDDEDVTFINERNRNFNKKISRAYDKFTKEIKDSFERGTAL